MSEEIIREKLDTMIDLLALDKKEIIEDKVNELGPLHKDILRRTEEWISPTEFKKEFAEKHSVTTKTVENRVSDLIEIGLLKSKGNPPAIEYNRAPFFNHVSFMEEILEG